MLSGSPHSSSSDPQLQGAQAPHLCPCSGLLPTKPWGYSPPFISPNPLYHPFLCSLHPSSLQGHHQSCPTAVLGHPSVRVPVSAPSPRGSATRCRWPPVHPSSSASQDTQLPGTPPFGVAASPGDPPGAPAWPVWAGLPGGLWPRHPARRAPAARPTPGLLPFPSAQPGVGSRGDTGEQTTALPGPDPAGYGAHGVPLQPLVWG